MVWKTVDVQSLQEGKIVAKDVVTRAGRKLISAGTSVTASHIETLKTWGIFSVEVMDVGDSGTPAERTGGGHHYSSEVQSLFQLNDPAHPLIERLMGLAEKEIQHERAR